MVSRKSHQPVFVCLYVYFVCSSVCLTAHLSACLLICLPSCLSVCLAAYLCACLLICLPVCSAVCLFFSMSACLFICLLIYLLGFSLPTYIFLCLLIFKLIFLLCACSRSAHLFTFMLASLSYQSACLPIYPCKCLSFFVPAHLSAHLLRSLLICLPVN